MYLCQCKHVTFHHVFDQNLSVKTQVWKQSCLEINKAYSCHHKFQSLLCVCEQELQCQNLDLEGDLFTVKREAEQTRQAAMDKTRVRWKTVNFVSGYAPSQ